MRGDCESHRRQCTPTLSSMYLRIFAEGIPWWPLVKILSFHCRGPGSIPGWGTKILHGAAKKIIIIFAENPLDTGDTAANGKEVAVYCGRDNVV